MTKRLLARQPINHVNHFPVLVSGRLSNQGGTASR
jgi:hypothetical protein